VSWIELQHALDQIFEFSRKEVISSFFVLTVSFPENISSVGS
jgi:hypothetical protein